MHQSQFCLRHWLAFLLLFMLPSISVKAQFNDSTEPWVGAPPPVPYEFIPIPEPWFGVTGQLLWLNRTEADGDQSLVVTTDATGDTSVIRMDDLNFPVEAGLRGSLYFGPPSGRYFELSYLGIYDQEASVSVSIDPATVTQTSRIFFGATTTSLTNFDYTTIYESDLHSAEFNLWSGAESWRFRPMVGLRWIGQSEQLLVFDSGTPSNGGIAEFDNDLLGAQMGFATVLWQRAGWFNVQAIGKAGVYRNDMTMTAALNSSGVPIASMTQDFTATSCVGEMNLTATWQLTPHFNLHVGYTGIWLTEVGLVGDQNDDFDILAGTGTVDLGGISYQGGHFGLSVTW